MSEHAIQCATCGTRFDARALDRVLAHEHKEDPWPSECYFVLRGHAGCAEWDDPDDMCEACRRRQEANGE